LVHNFGCFSDSLVGFCGLWVKWKTGLIISLRFC